MRSPEDIHQYLRGYLGHVFRRPSMYAPGLGSVDLVYAALHHLAFIDERIEELVFERSHWKDAGCWPSTGLVGAFVKRLGGAPEEHTLRMLSVHAETAHRMGYLDVDRLLPATEWKSLMKGLQQRIRSRVWTCADIHQTHGSPSLTIGSLDAYVSHSGAFCCFDYEGYRPASRLLVVRRPSKKFSSAFVLATNCLSQKSSA